LTGFPPNSRGKPDAPQTSNWGTSAYIEHRFTNKNLTPQPPSPLSLALPYKGREKEKLLFLEGGVRIPLRSIGEGFF